MPAGTTRSGITFLGFFWKRSLVRLRQPSFWIIGGRESRRLEPTSLGYFISGGLLLRKQQQSWDPCARAEDAERSGVRRRCYVTLPGALSDRHLFSAARCA